jgi:hypothetical protein
MDEAMYCKMRCWEEGDERAGYLSRITGPRRTAVGVVARGTREREIEID